MAAAGGSSSARWKPSAYREPSAGALRAPSCILRSAMLPFFILAALAYGAASFAYGAGADEGSSVKQWARALLAGAALLHLATIGAQCVDGNHPFKSVFLATSLG